MNQRRRQILDDMGIALWLTRERVQQLRSAAGATVHGRTVPRNAEASRSEPSGSGSAPLQTLPQALPQALPGSQRVASPRAGAAPLNLPDVTLAWVEDALYVGPVRGDRRVLRFVRDLLCAVVQTRSPMHQQRFGATDIGRDFGLRQLQAAFQAYLGKQLAQRQARVLLLDSALPQALTIAGLSRAPLETQSLPNVAGASALWLPDVSKLLADGDGKRRCWLALQRLPAAPTRAASTDEPLADG